MVKIYRNVMSIGAGFVMLSLSALFLFAGGVKGRSGPGNSSGIADRGRLLRDIAILTAAVDPRCPKQEVGTLRSTGKAATAEFAKEAAPLSAAGGEKGTLFDLPSTRLT